MLILHIGLPKTGTTSVQQAFHINRDELLNKHGVLYPSISFNHGIPLFSAFSEYPEKYHINVRRGVASRKLLYAEREKLLFELEEELMVFNYHTTFISGEDLCNLKEDEVGNLINWFANFFKKIKVLVFVREPLSWAQSAYQQLIKSGSTKVELDKNIRLPNYRYRIMPWVNHLGKDSINCVKFEDKLKNKYGVLGYVLEWLKLDLEKLNDDFGKSNESLSNEVIQILSSLNSNRNPLNSPQRFNGDIEVFKKLSGLKFTLAKKLQEYVLANCKNDVSWLKKMFGVEYSYAKDTSFDKTEAILDPDFANTLGILLSDMSNEIRFYQYLYSKVSKDLQLNKYLTETEMENLKKLSPNAFQIIFPGYPDDSSLTKKG